MFMVYCLSCIALSLFHDWLLMVSGLLFVVVVVVVVVVVDVVDVVDAFVMVGVRSH